MKANSVVMLVILVVIIGLVVWQHTAITTSVDAILGKKATKPTTTSGNTTTTAGGFLQGLGLNPTAPAASAPRITAPNPTNIAGGTGSSVWSALGGALGSFASNFDWSSLGGDSAPNDSIGYTDNNGNPLDAGSYNPNIDGSQYGTNGELLATGSYNPNIDGSQYGVNGELLDTSGYNPDITAGGVMGSELDGGGLPDMGNGTGDLSGMA